MRKMLIADGSPMMTAALSQALYSDFDLRVSHDGFETLDLIESFRPDVLIINLLLPHLDGISVLEQVSHRPRIILAMTNYISSYIQHHLLELGVDFTMICPTVTNLLARLEDLLKRQVIVRDPEDLQGLASAYLHALGIPSHLDGYRQLCFAIPMFASDPRQLLTKEIYPTIAEHLHCRDARTVEHSIRKAICVAWERRNLNVWGKYFPCNADGDILCPSNKEFICTLAEYLLR